MTPETALNCFIGPTEANQITHESKKIKRNASIIRLMNMLEADNDDVIIIMARIRAAARSGDDFVKINRGEFGSSMIFALLSNCGYAIVWEPHTVTIYWRTV